MDTFAEGKRVSGKDLKVGTLISVWWSTGETHEGHNIARLQHIYPYKGLLTIWDKTGGARIGRFNSQTPRGYVEMTIPASSFYTTYKRKSGR
jgi:hypothetical protein